MTWQTIAEMRNVLEKMKSDKPELESLLSAFDLMQKSILDFEAKNYRQIILEILNNFTHLQVNSDDSKVKNAVENIKSAAQNVFNNFKDSELDILVEQADKFLILSDAIAKNNFDAQDFIKIAKLFSDTPLLAYALTLNILHFTPRLPEIEMPATQDVTFETFNVDLPEPSIQKINQTLIKFDNFLPDTALVEVAESDFTIQTNAPDFNATLPLDKSDFFMRLIKTRIVVQSQADIFNFPAEPELLNMLFDSGVVDKISWRGVVFYFLNDFGLELCAHTFHLRALSLQTDAHFLELLFFLQAAPIFLYSDQIKFCPELSAGLLNLPNNQVVVLFSMLALGSDWAYRISKFKLLIEKLLADNVKIKAVYLFGWLRNDILWLKMFDTFKFRYLKFFMFTLDGLFDMTGERLDKPAVNQLPQVNLPTENNKLSTTNLQTAVERATYWLRQGKIELAVLIMNAASDYQSRFKTGEGDNVEKFARALAYIFDDPMSEKKWLHYDTMEFWKSKVSGYEVVFEYLNLAVMIKNYYAPKLNKIKSNIDSVLASKILKKYPHALKLIKLFAEYAIKNGVGFAEVISLNEPQGISKSQATENIAEVIKETELMIFAQRHKNLRNLMQDMFGKEGKVRKYLSLEKVSREEILQFCKKFEGVKLEEVKIAEESNFDFLAIEDFVDEEFKLQNVPSTKLKRQRLAEHILKVLIALTNYVKATEPHKVKNIQLPLESALNLAVELDARLEKLEGDNLGQLALKLFVKRLMAMLQGKNFQFSYKECLLGKDYIEMVNNLPRVSCFNLQGESLWERTKAFEESYRSQEFKTNLLLAYENCLRNYDCGSLRSLAKYYLTELEISAEELKRKLTAMERQAPRQIEKLSSEFLNTLTVSGLSDTEVSRLISSQGAAKKHFLATRNVGQYKKFLRLCSAEIAKSIQPQKALLLNRLENLNAQNKAFIEQLVESGDLIVAEDYINRLENGEEVEFDIAENQTLLNFLSEYEVLFRAIESSGGAVENAFKQRIEYTGKVNRQTQNSIDFAHGWQLVHSGQTGAAEIGVGEILKHLGFSGMKLKSRNIISPNQKIFTYDFEAARQIVNFPHPIKAFGSELKPRGLEVICLTSRRSYENIAQVLLEAKSDLPTICLLDSSLTLPERRKLAKIFKQTPTLKDTLLIDTVMALYLAFFDDANRQKRLLQVCVPFARIQPFVAVGSVPPEMFIGRAEELDKLRDMQGPVFVYGGRQLGKSALLRHVWRIENNPTKGSYAFFIDLKNLTTSDALRKIAFELQNAKLIGKVNSWQDFSFEIHKLLSSKKIQKLLLLMDESDAFLSQSNSEFVIDILREILVAFSGKFKFVLAGLHKVIRFEQNSGFGNLNHLTVLPFKPTDALRLLSVLNYLGFIITDKAIPSAIFSRANYYPGLIQYYCKMLVESLTTNYDNHKFDVTKNPPYPLDANYLKSLLGAPDFLAEIKQRFFLTLSLDDDNYYEIIALSIALLYYEMGSPIAVSAADIRDTCAMCGVEKITNLSDANLAALLEEMVLLNLLRRVDDKFEFNRYSFWQMMGKDENDVTQKLDAFGISKTET